LGSLLEEADESALRFALSSKGEVFPSETRALLQTLMQITERKDKARQKKIEQLRAGAQAHVQHETEQLRQRHDKEWFEPSACST